MPKFWNSVYLTKRIRVKSDFRKASDVRFEATWYALAKSMKGSDTLVLRLDKVRELQVWYRP